MHHGLRDKACPRCSGRGWIKALLGLALTLLNVACEPSVMLPTGAEARLIEGRCVSSIGSVASAQRLYLVDDQTADCNPPGIVTFPIRVTLTDQPLLGSNGFMLEAAIAICALIVLAGVLWLRPWVDDYSNPYE